MKERKLFDAITQVEDDLVEEARTGKPKKRGIPWKRLTAIAACAALILGGMNLLPHETGSVNGPMEGPVEGAVALAGVLFPKAYAFEDYEGRRESILANPVEEEFIAKVNEFSYETASQIMTGQKGNLNYSPLSLYYALGLAALGAEGETERELLGLLGVPDRDTLAEQSGNLYRRLYFENSIGRLKLANSLWMDQSVSWKQPFVDQAAQQLYASSFSVDFSDEKTGRQMGQWIAEQTQGRLNPEVTLSPGQILSILNTVYFYDQWIDKFEEEKTARDRFTLPSEAKVSCDFMNQTYSSAGFAKGEGFTRAGLSLKNGGRMVFILPDEGISPRDLLATPEKAKAVFEEGEECWGQVIWQIPKFSFATQLELADTLKALGVQSAFHEGADFGGITDQTAFISSIRQETHIGIDEKGVEAAAYTQIDYMGAAPPKDKAEMILNRPFLYGITASDGTLLFMGICENPVKG